MAQFFFTSFAAAENRSYVSRFHRDLLAALEELTGRPPVAALAPGGGSARLCAPAGSRAAAGAAVMVALCSDAYYADELCGLDWGLFDRRLELRRAALCSGPEPRVLVRWLPADPPHGLPRASYGSTGAVADYARIGLAGIMHRRAWHAPDYTGAVREIARKVRDAHGGGMPALAQDEQAAVRPVFPVGPLHVPGERLPSDGARGEPPRPSARPAVGPAVRDAAHMPAAGRSAAGPARAGRPPVLPADADRQIAAADRPEGRLFYISYAEPDQDWASWVEFHVRLLGHRTEMDVYDWQPGSPSAVRRRAALENADKVIALISPDYVLPDSPTGPEWADALEHRGPGREPRFLPVVVRRTRLPGLLRGLITASLVGLDGAAARRALATALAGRGERERPQKEPPLPSP